MFNTEETLSFNRPRFCPTAIWNSNGITFADQSIVGLNPYTIFVNTNNTIYAVNGEHNTIVIWHEESVNPTKIISGNFIVPGSLFVTSNGDIYIDDGSKNGQVQRWRAETGAFATVMNVSSRCEGLFVDIYDTLYCSMVDHHQVVKRSLNDSEMASNRVAAGTGIDGSDSDELDGPGGIFVDVNLDLYVTDCYNDRVQLFQSGESDGITVAGRTSPFPTVRLSCPNGIVLDVKKYLFIVDFGNHRIVGSGVNGFRCLVGCYGEGSQSNQLYGPFGFSFDRSGNMFVTDAENHRIQKFEYLEELCGFPSVIQTPYSSAVQSNYPLQLTMNSQTYSRDCRKSNYYYQAIRMKVMETGYYALSSNSSINTFGDIYKDDFNPINPFENLLSQNYRACSSPDFKFVVYLHTDTKYILVVTTSSPNMTGDFYIETSGPNNITLDPYTQILTSCFIGRKCQFYKKSIGVILDDILRDEIRPNMTITEQTITVKVSAALTMIMLAGGLINSILSLLTFQNKDLRQVGCGIYLLASSITSFLTISMFTVKFWFVVLTQMDLSIRLSVVRGGCVSIEPLLKLCLYMDAWLNACVAIERAILVFKGIKFNKQNSQRIARWIILILPLCIMGSIIHEPIYRELREINTETSKGDIDRWCITRYSSSVQQYDTIILFFHLVAPCIINLCSALFIIFGSARQRSAAQTRQTLREHVYHQFNEHKQLLISPIILLILSLPRLIMSMLSECVNPSNHRLLFIFGYFISFTPSMLIFIVFVLPSALYRKTFQESFRRWRRQIRR
ncbi:unnamed protein product [Adineta steineri]|uniref:G-protein coupled receptors family 1 profile domain-containing protein n=1 Tax=Adineta steineri TaxID=433720 RepID=A0A815D0S9_9BILA|nr:unnamed protein product [Adineta steineri]CAF1287157.1 unnamed protein product [Adineta steineri]